MKIYISFFMFVLSGILLESCGNKVSELPEVDDVISVGPNIYPDYKDIVIPYNIAPLRFALCEKADESLIQFHTETEDVIYKSKKGNFLFDNEDWHCLMNENQGKTLKMTVLVKEKGHWKAFKPFEWTVSSDATDEYIAYRLIPPGYEYWNEMGIYQRNVSSYEENMVISNRYTESNCMNCHSFCMQSPERFMFHMRENLGGTYIVDHGVIEKINGKVDESIKGLVYPSWHPSGRYIAFSTNDIFQTFHLSDRNRVEVYDKSSDVVAYDVRNHKVVTVPQLMADNRFETFPTFSADGRRMFFCSAEAKEMPKELKAVKYSLCSIAFDVETGTFGTRVDTLFNAEANNKSVSFPRVSPDNRYLVFTVSDYGQFSIWHKEADLYIADLTQRTVSRLDGINSDDVESYHSWSSNGRWMVFSSRREDGLYTKLYLSHIDGNGNASKPFLLPQKHPDFYKSFMFSYNIPEFIKGKVDINPMKIVNVAKGEGVKVSRQQ